jgi:2-polyprenyl-3-methyl-5-hydroxy-6-metoxy-1,4-benzoquinol methylase
VSTYDYSIQYSQFHDESYEHAQQMADSLIGVLKQDIPTDRTIPVLDIGCGQGFALLALKKLGFNQLQGLEISQEQASQCRKNGIKVDVSVNTIEWLHHHQSEFKLVLLLDVLEHIPVNNQIDFMRAVHGVMAPNGKLVLTVPNANSVLFGRWRHIDFTHFSSYTEHSLFFVLRNAGFESIKLDSSKGITRFPRRLWSRSAWPRVRKWIVRWCWLQVFKAELPGTNLDEISFELNLKATAIKQ